MEGGSHGLDLVVDALCPGDRAALRRLLDDRAGDEPARTTAAAERATAIDAGLNWSATALRTPEGLTLPGLADPEGAEPSALPVRRPLPERSLEDVLRRRRSAYEFGARMLEVELLGDLLGWSFGVARRVALPDGEVRALPFSPAAGGLASTAVFAVTRRVSGVGAGVWRYLPQQHALAPVAVGDATPHLSAAYLQAAFAERAPVTLVLTADLRATLASYPLRHYRTLHTDTGVAAQTLALVGAALGLASCMVAGYRDGVVADLLRLEDGVLPTLLVPVGPPP